MLRSAAGCPRACRAVLDAGPDLVDRLVLHRPEAADLHRRRGDRHEGAGARPRQLREEAGDDILVPPDQVALLAPLGRVAERIERGSPEPLEPGERPERHPDPGAEPPLARAAAMIRAGGQERRREVVMHRVIALEFLGQALEEPGLGVQPRDLVLVLVGHQLEQRAGDRLAQGGRAGRRLGGADPVDHGAVAPGIGRVLVGGEEVGAAGDDPVDRLRRHRPVARDGQRRGLRACEAADGEGRLVALDLDLVQLDRPHQGLMRHRHEPPLPGHAQHDHVGVDRIAAMGLGHPVGVEGAQVVPADHPADRGEPRLHGEARIAQADDVAGRHLGGVDHRPGPGR